MSEKMVFNNSGDFRGASVFQGSTLYNAGQIAGTMLHADAASKADLQKLLQQLGMSLKAVPPEKVEDAEAVGAAAEDLVKETAKDKPNTSRLRALGNLLVDAAKAVGSAAPAAISLANQIVDLVARIGGAGGGTPPTIAV